MIETIKKLYDILDRRARLYFGLLLIPMAIIAVMEMFSIAMILPVIQVIVLEDKSSGFLAGFFESIFSETQGRDAILSILSVFAAVFVVKNILILVQNYIINRVAASQTARYTIKAFDVYINKKILFHYKTSSSSMLQNIFRGINDAMEGVRIFVMILFDVFALVAVFVFLLIYDIRITMATIAVFGAITLLYLKIMNPLFKSWATAATSSKTACSSGSSSRSAR